MSEKNKLDPNNWICKYYEYLFNYARKSVRDEHKVEDLIQDTFIAALHSLKSFKSQSKERTWLVSILKHKIIDHYRQKNTKKGKAQRYVVSHEEFYNLDFKDAATTDGSETVFELEQNQCFLSNRLRSSLKKLPEKQAKVLEMRYLLEYDIEIICEKLGISKNSVWVLSCRAKKKLASNFNAYKNAI